MKILIGAQAVRRPRLTVKTALQVVALSVNAPPMMDCHRCMPDIHGCHGRGKERQHTHVHVHTGRSTDRTSHDQDIHVGHNPEHNRADFKDNGSSRYMSLGLYFAVEKLGEYGSHEAPQKDLGELTGAVGRRDELNFSNNGVIENKQEGRAEVHENQKGPLPPSIYGGGFFSIC